MKYKQLKELPDYPIGTIWYKGEGEYVSGDGSYPLHTIENNSEWFAPFVLKTEDGVDTYVGDKYYAVFTESFQDIKANIVYVGHIARQGNFSYLAKMFSTRQAAENYVKCKFKVGDIITTNSGNTYKILEVLGNSNYEFVRVQGKHSLLDLLVSICRKATNEEIISYYEKLGWVHGATFEYEKNIYQVSHLDLCTIFNGVFVWHKKIHKEASGFLIDNCKLLNYPKSWEDLKTVDGYYIDTDSDIEQLFPSKTISINKNVYKTEKQAESALAFAQLSQLIARTNGDTEFEDGWAVVKDVDNSLTIFNSSRGFFRHLVFKSRELAEFSLEHHRNLWKKYYDC